MKYFSRGHCAQRLIVTCIMTFMMPDIANAIQGSSDPEFQVGESCAALAYGSADAYLWLIESLDNRELEEFCYPEEPSFCSDYTDFLHGIGRLEFSEGGEGGMCRLIQD